MGAERVEVTVERHWVEGPAVAGGGVETVFLVADARGRRFRVRRREGREALVEVEQTAPDPETHG